VRTARPLYTGLRVRDLDRSVRFYRALGFRQTLRLKTGLGEAAQLEHPSNGFTLELNVFPKGSKAYEPLRRGTELDHLGFEVKDVDGTTRRLVRAGGKVTWRPYDTKIWIHGKGVFDGRAAYVSDPDGVWIELLGPARGPPQRRRRGA
jgi:catechol 2,3-dioxygenase-like lactoylglutathione lyase family enzyme